MTDMQRISEEVVCGHRAEVQRLVESALGAGHDAADILSLGLIPGMTVVGQKMAHGTFFLPEVLVAARAMQAGLELLKPIIAEEGVAARGVAVIGTVKGDVHDIGKNLVGIMLEGSGFKVVDLGVNVAAERFADAIRDNGADILGMSAMLTTTMLGMRTTTQLLKKRGLRDAVKIMIGGAPVNQAWADEIGADAYCENCTLAVERAKALVPGT